MTDGDIFEALRPSDSDLENNDQCGNYQSKFESAIVKSGSGHERLIIYDSSRVVFDEELPSDEEVDAMLEESYKRHNCTTGDLP